MDNIPSKPHLVSQGTRINLAIFLIMNVLNKHTYTFLFKRGLLIWVGLLTSFLYANAQFIKKQPRDTTICKAAYAAEFKVEVEDAYKATAKYMWYIKTPGSTSFKPVGTPASYSYSYTATVAGEYYCYIYFDSDPRTQSSDIVTLTFIDIPTITGINAPGVCNKSDLHATAVGIENNGSSLSNYKWELKDITVKSGAVTNNTVPDLTIFVDSTQQNATLRLSLTNACGTGSVFKQIVVNPTPAPPSVTSKNTYCQDEPAQPLSIAQTNATWYTQKTGGQGTHIAPTPNTSVAGTQTWWVSQTVVYADVSCEGYRAEAKVVITPLSDLPTTTKNLAFCIGDPETTLTATGTDLRWYDESGALLPNAPKVKTSEPGIKIYYVTQTQSGKCESPKQKITVTVKSRATEDLIQLSDIPPTICPYSSTILEASTSKEITDPTFRWYADVQKTTLLQTGSTYTTPVLSANATYYVTLEYAGFCESLSPKTAIIIVNDDVRPEFYVPPPPLDTTTNDGVCYATNIHPEPPVVKDNCTDYADLKIYIESEPTQYDLGVTTITWWAEDLMGNKDYILQTITVKDKEFPKGTCPKDMEIVVNDDITSAIVTYDLNYTDNCGVTHVTLESGYPSGSAFPLGETIVRHSIVDTAGNAVSCEFKVLVRHPYRALELALRVMPGYEICPGQAVTVIALVSGGSEKYTYTWTPRPWTNAALEDYPLETTTYEVTVNDGFVIETRKVTIAVLETQPVQLAYDGRMDEILEGDEVVVKATSGFSSYKFLLNNEVVQEVGLNDQVAFIAELGTYAVRVFATDENYCVAQDQLDIVVESKKLPNVFTPNHDGKNEIFLEGYDLTVFSRAGELIYKGTTGWDGTYKGKVLPQGTYLYVVRRTMNNGEFRIYKGTVTLKL